jgi:hypothetical protein
LPNGVTWVDVAVRGDPKSSERGLVYCKLCRHYSKQNVFGKGYRWVSGLKMLCNTAVQKGIECSIKKLHVCEKCFFINALHQSMTISDVFCSC